MNRKRKLRIVQTFLLFLGSIVLILTYYNKDKSEKKIISTEEKNEIKNQLLEDLNEGDMFFNIEYSGLDLEGNRFILKSKKGYNDKSKENFVIMETVNATFYFKDDTELNLLSDKGIYNNQTLDMEFIGNVKAWYDKGELFAENASYSNSKSFIKITNDVKIKSDDGIMFADELFLDIKKKSMDITSLNNNKVNAEFKLK